MKSNQILNAVCVSDFLSVKKRKARNLGREKPRAASGMLLKRTAVLLVCVQTLTRTDVISSGGHCARRARPFGARWDLTASVCVNFTAIFVIIVETCTLDHSSDRLTSPESFLACLKNKQTSPDRTTAGVMKLVTV